METVSFDLIKHILSHINRTEKQAALLSNRKKWNRLTSALYVLEDTSWAVEYYLKSEYPSDFKGQYLFTYGLLQALFVQGDAVNSISVALFDRKVEFKTEYPKAFAVREMRNDVTGHPTQRGTNQYIYLAQNSLEKESFYYSKDNADTGLNDIINVNVSDAISEMATCINTILKKAVEELDEEFKQYIEQHRGRKMKEIFRMLHYYREKALLNADLGPLGYDSTKDLVKRCEEELISRYGSVDVVDSYKILLEEIHEIYALIDDGLPQIPEHLQSGFKKYMLEVLFSKLEELESYCEETDSYFENYGREKTQSNPCDAPTIIWGGQDLED